MHIFLIYKQSSTYKTAYNDACKTHYTVPSVYKRLPEDEPSVSKHVEDY